MNQPLILKRGEAFPLPLPTQDGAILELFRNDLSSQLLIAVPGLSASEVHSLRKGPVDVGILVEQTAVLVLWQFKDRKGRPVMDFDTSFDARLIPPEGIHLVDKTKTQERLLTTVIVVDSHTRLVKGLRSLTLPKAVTDALLSATMDQIAHPELAHRAMAQHVRWRSLPIDALMAQARMLPAGV